MMISSSLVLDDSTNDELSMQRHMRWYWIMLSSLFEEKWGNSFENPWYHGECKESSEYFKYFLFRIALEFFTKARNRHTYTEHNNHKDANNERYEKEILVDTRYKSNKPTSCRNSTFTSTKLSWSCTKSCPLTSYTAWFTRVGVDAKIHTERCLSIEFSLSSSKSELICSK